jgi:N-acetylneuraminate synthase
MYKIASLETGDHNLIRAVAETGKPIIVSTGATEWNEIEELVSVVNDTGNKDLTLLLCTSAYPAEPVDSHLKRIQTLQNAFQVKVGLSDHTLGMGASIAAIALGASVIEKHVTLRRSDGGADSAFSMEPEEFAKLVVEGKKAYAALGSTEWKMQESEKESRRLRRSLYVVADVKVGDLVSVENVKPIRPGYGCQPKYLSELIGMKFRRSVEAGTPMSFELVEDNSNI